ncbi:hypothetical protein [Burkholderia stagnalis]
MWNEALGTLIVESEISSERGKPNKSTVGEGRRGRRSRSGCKRWHRGGLVRSGCRGERYGMRGEEGGERSSTRPSEM